MRRPIRFREQIPVTWRTPREETWEELVRAVALNSRSNILGMRRSIERRYPELRARHWYREDQSSFQWARDFIGRMVADMPRIEAAPDVPLSALVIEADARYQLRTVTDRDGRIGIETLCVDVEHAHGEPCILATFWETDCGTHTIPLEEFMDVVSAHHRTAER
jgi:hypothetical protein